MRKTTGTVIKFRKGEKIIISILSIFVIVLPIIIVYSSAYASSLNIDIEKLREQINTQENLNTSLSMEIDELASLSNIKDIAKNHGLRYDNDKIIVIK